MYLPDIPCTVLQDNLYVIKYVIHLYLYKPFKKVGFLKHSIKTYAYYNNYSVVCFEISFWEAL